MKSDQLSFDIPIASNGETRDTREIWQLPAPQKKAIEDLPREPIGETVCTSIALQRICKRLGDFSASQLYRVINKGGINAFKPGSTGLRSDGKRSNADLQICTKSLERFICRKEIEARIGER